MAEKKKVRKSETPYDLMKRILERPPKKEEEELKAGATVTEKGEA